jgi:hypothetical protein
MGFSILVELLNLRLRARSAHPVDLREAYVAETVAAPVPVMVQAKRPQKKSKSKGRKR